MDDDPARAVPSGLPHADFGWAPLHAFHRLLAAEEGIDLPSMTGFGGTRLWDSLQSPTRLLFDLDYVNGPHLTAVYPDVVARLSAIHGRWTVGMFAQDPGAEWLPGHLTAKLAQLIEVLTVCSRTGTRVIIR